MSRLVAVIAAIVVVMMGLAVTFVAGMRHKSLLVLNSVKRVSRAMKPLMMKSAGRPGAWASVVHHVGRTSGRSYVTPVQAVRTEDGFAIALPYGPTTDWLKNVQAAGSATIVTGGSTYIVDQPRVVPLKDVGAYFPEKDQRQHRRFDVRDAVRLHRTDVDVHLGELAATAM